MFQKPRMTAVFDLRSCKPSSVMAQHNCLFELCFGRIFQKKKKQPVGTLSILIFLPFVDKSQEHVTKNKTKKTQVSIPPE